jgi:hypothetical protein
MTGGYSLCPCCGGKVAFFSLEASRRSPLGLENTAASNHPLKRDSADCGMIATQQDVQREARDRPRSTRVEFILVFKGLFGFDVGVI